MAKKKSNRGKGRQRPRPKPAEPSTPSVPRGEPDTSERLIDEWSGTRSGAWASRGFDFQHTVAAWLAARLTAGDLAARGLVPEGFEDITIESETSRHVQIKSRGEHLGLFPVGTASRHIVDSWLRHRKRGRESESLTVVFERGVEGEAELSRFDTPLGESLAQDSPLRLRIRATAQDRELEEQEIEALLEATSVYGVSWSSVDADSRALLGAAFDRLQPAALNYLARELRVVMTENATLNATVTDYVRRHFLDRSELERRCKHFMEQVDLDALEAAVTLGLCSPLSFADPMHDERFYEGVATQPGHVAAGLVVPRADLIGEAVTGVEATSSVILTGPSGVGKSALLWSIPHALPGVLWFRVNRLTPADVPEILRLCRSHRVSDANPIGLLIDAAGTGLFSGWSVLREEVAATPGLFSISTSRHEDLISLGDLSGCTTIAVALDEAAAEAIFNGLRNRDATDSPHWKEAFDQARGLTLEFTHMLTRGQRLGSVVTEQIRRRVAERRNTELDLLSLTATADQWSVSLSVDQAAEACGVSQLELREPIARLAAEHLLIERNGTISGVHQLRSIAISNAIHDQPPPTLEHTVSRLLPALEPEQVKRFIPNALRDEPQLDQLFHDAALNERNGAVGLTAYLRGLRLFDFYERALSWETIAERHGVPPAHRAFTQLFAITGAGLPEVFPEEVNRAVTAMTAAPEAARGSAVISAAGAERVAETLATTDNLRVATELLFELGQSRIEIAVECQSRFSTPTPLLEAVQRATVEQVADLVVTAHSIDPNLAQTFIEASGGEAALISKIRKADPWIIELRIDDSADGPVAYARSLHVSDAVHGDPHGRVIALGRLLLRCFPRTTHVDVKLVLPGNHDYRIGEHQLGSTNLRREHDHSELTVAWNRERMRVTNAILGATDTERLAAALPLLDATARLTTIVGNAFAAADVRHLDTDQLADQVNSLGDQAKQVRPRLSSRERRLDIAPDQEAKESEPITADPLSGLVTDLTGNIFPRLTKLDNPVALAAHLSDQVIAKSLRRAQREPWHLLGYNTYPQGLKSLETDLHNLLAIVAEIATDSSTEARLRRAARAGGHQGALRRGAEAARTITRRRLQARKTQLEQVGRDIGQRFRVRMPQDDEYQVVAERLIALEVPSLIEWSNTLEAASTAIQAAGLPGEKFTLVPLRGGKPVAKLAMHLVTLLIPVGDLGRWASELAEAHETPLAEAFDAAIASLQVASGVLALPEANRSYNVVAQVAENAKQELVRSRQTLEQAPRDAITEQITQLIDSLYQALTNEETGENSRGDIASRLLQMQTQGHQTEMTVAVYVARLMALEWDIDRDAAEQLFE